MTEHKHAEVLRAIADGKKVQWKTKDKSDKAWITFRIDTAVNPITHEQLDWRVKPEPKHDVVRYFCLYPNGISNAGAIRGSHHNLRCVFADDGLVTLKSAEVLV